jgi:hypothetical protein
MNLEATRTIESVPAVLHGSGRQTLVDLEVERYSPIERIRPAFTRLIGFWVIGGLSAFIPVVHLFSVPGFFIAGIVAAFMTWRREAAFLPFDAACPACGETLSFDLDGKPELPKLLPCPACGAGLVAKRRTTPQL